MDQNPQLSALCLLIRRFGARIPGGGYEVSVSHREMAEMPRSGTFQEVPEPDKATTRWQYFPNPTIDLEPTSVSDPVAPEGLPEKTGG